MMACSNSEWAACFFGQMLVFVAENHLLCAQEPFHQLLVLLMCVKHMSLSSSDQIFITACNPTFHNSRVTMHMVMDECIVQGDLAEGS